MCEQLGDNKTFEPEIAAARTGRDPICSGARPEASTGRVDILHSATSSIVT